MLFKPQFEVVMARLKDALGAPTYADVGRALGLTTSAYANRKKADSIPYDALVPLAHSRNMSLEWLLFGEGPPTLDGDAQARAIPEVDADLLMRAIVALAREMGAPQDALHDVGRWAGLACLVYNKVVHSAPQVRASLVSQLATDFGRAAKIMDTAGTSYAIPVAAGLQQQTSSRVQEEPGDYDGADEKPTKPRRGPGL